jgi:serine/threonine-protein kinase
VIHRDIKPHNVIVDEEGRAKVTDFGIARAGASDMTQTGSILGTAQYLSPEQAQGHAVDATSDLYSIGIMLYELLTGRVPFDGESAVSIALKQVNERPVPPSAVNRAVTPELEAVVLRALEKDPARRFPDDDAFIAALEHARAALHGPPSYVEERVVHDGGYVPPPLEELYEEEGGPRWWLWLVALLLIAAVAVGGYLIYNRSSGPGQATVPDVVGTDQAAAITALQHQGFQTRSVSKTSSDQAKGTVIKTDPGPNEKADKGSVVTLTVSGGPGTAQIPTVGGLSRTDARARLERAGFQIRESREKSDTVSSGDAIRTRPKSGTTLEKGQTVTLVLSSGKPQVSVPDVTGQSFDQASQELTSAGLKVQRNDQVSASEDPGTVLKQSPGAGAKVDKGSTVQVAVAKQPQDVEVPDVTGETQADAVQRLSQDGFEIKIAEQSVPTQEDDGHVIDQNPPGGERHKRGSTVTLTVAKFDPAAAGQTTTTPAAPGTTSTTPTTP